MRRIIVVRTSIWEEVIAEEQEVEDVVTRLLAEDEPDYEALEVSEE